ncbi:hypothetical protein SAMN04488564_103697 [Lentzea waywayandensis]|uniref:Uncharacterized protein n=1 Tax=Lentzea waywayandensis TaxID=84724 RepID=A0A1I6E2C5_9PSEU|nr:hypothetical protein [Lentzea waywayandensis]SFR11900.1 hypothetical protein SAMN04488564_103697 [Lentzea waywayandensis]
MELKQAMEAATSELDVRPGFVGDVMAGGRRRHTRKLVTVTAVVALLAGVTTGVVLTRSTERSADPRLTAATTGPLAGDSEFIATASHLWSEAQKDEPWKRDEPVTEVSSKPNVFWTGQTPTGPAALVAQEVWVRTSEHPATLVGLVADGKVVNREIVLSEARDREAGLYRFGPVGDQYVVLTLGKTVSWSQNPKRGPDNRLTRTWASAPHDEDGVVFTVVPPEERPVFVRGDSVPQSDDFTQPTILTGDLQPDRPFVPHPGLGWEGQFCATAFPEQKNSWPGLKLQAVQHELQKRALLDYIVSWEATTDWSVCAWLPDGRYALMFESLGELYGALYQPDGTFSAPVVGGKAVKGEPAVLSLPDGQGTIVADANALVGPQEREHAWLAPSGTKEVTVRQKGVPKVIQLP